MWEIVINLYTENYKRAGDIVIYGITILIDIKHGKTGLIRMSFNTFVNAVLVLWWDLKRKPVKKRN